ncbi:TetR/AcrR family transcriptional regulator [Kibdelosporangium philippinense]|uniref:TetR/AcrR family transcriptional regulator n=1 Tax=Kibdelosporangium philippinense TaxID=211113 RepID=A0ABS8ZIW3_9PSEU|nr:TetR/AcrR family transcriptional regulator [Kibdelosporangium philippinense]MCE7007716.1 TetR/AcrR family transcriptional regulator [Kibdelosporangium philippinense]
MKEAVSTRRERLRAETSREIKAIALKLMADNGPDGISLRAIAREMGMTAGAIYGYFATRDDLITTLISDVYTDLVDQMEAARDSKREDDAGGRLLAWGEAFREWAVANPQGFRLIYGDPVNGYQSPGDGAAPEAERRACLGLAALVAAVWPEAEATQSFGNHRWSDFDPSLVAVFRESFPGLPPAAVALSLRVWGRMHGPVALEIYGHLAAQTHQPAKLYRAELLDLLAALSVPVSAKRS